MKNEIELTLNKNCVGCRACESLCPTNSIFFCDSEEGFLVPRINGDTCIGCHKCINCCPQINEQTLNRNITTYAGINNNTDIVLDSSSGGVMSALADVIIRNGGCVFGTYLDSKDWKCKYTYADTTVEINKFRGSKYVQSDTKNSFEQVKTKLEKNEQVLYVGVPCQIAGLKAYLGNYSQDGLYVIDILCHGATSPLLFRKHVEYLEKKYNKKLKKFYFRDKTRFQSKVALKYVFDDDEEKYILGKCEKYFQAFISGATYRMPCYSCKYARRQRMGDITLGDYWGIGKVHPDFDNSRGASLIMVNSPKGVDLLRKADLYLVESDLDSAANGNGILNGPSQMDPNREKFYDELNSMGYEYAIKNNIVVKPMIYSIILSNMPQSIIKILSKIKR